MRTLHQFVLGVMDDSSTRDLVLGCCLVIAETLDDMCVESLFLSNVSSFTEPLLRTLLTDWKGLIVVEGLLLVVKNSFS